MTQEVEKEAIVCVTAVHFYGTQKTEMSFCGKTEKGARVDRSATSKAPNLYFTRVPNDVKV